MSDDICIYTIVMQHILQYKAGHRKEFCVPINCVFQRNVLNLCEPAHISAYKNRATCYNKKYRKKTSTCSVIITSVKSEKRKFKLFNLSTLFYCIAKQKLCYILDF